MRISKIKRIPKAVTCIILVLCLGILGGFQLAGSAQETPVQYLADIKMYYGTLEDSRKLCEADGYIFCESDLNAGTEQGGVYIGYKTTADRDKSICDIRMLGMDRDYYLYNYEEILDYLKKSNVGTTERLYNAAVQFTENYNAGSPKAKDAYDGLNLFYVGSDAEKLGDYILQGKADKDFFSEMVVKSSTGTLNAVTTFLNYGIAPYTSEEGGSTNWAAALATEPLWETVNGNITTAERSDLDKKYNDDAKVLFEGLQTFTTQYENALARHPDYEEGKLDDIFKTDDVSTVEDAIEKMDDVKDEDTDQLYLAAVELLNKYNVNETTRLGDWLIELGLQTSDKVDMIQLYPLVEAMGTAQVGLIGNLGFLAAVSNLGENETNNDVLDMIAKAKDAIYEYNQKDCMSVWDNADDDIDKSYVAYTSDAVRTSDANNQIGKKSGFEIFDEKFEQALEYINLASGAAFVAVGAVYVSFSVAAWALGATAGAGAVCATIATGCAVALSSLGTIGLAVLLVTVSYYIFKWALSLIKENVPTIDHSKFPDYVFDSADTADGEVTVKYKSVRDQDGNVGDLNRRKQSKWALLAYTTDKNVGSPVRADSEGNIFKVLYGDAAVQNGYDCVNFFGERNPANANYQTSKDKKHGVYISYRTEQSIENEVSVPDTEAQQTEVTETTNYIKDIIVATAGDTNSAKAKITKKQGKYYVLDYNMSPDTGIATYIGYQMTTNADEAITDIRIAPYHGNDAVVYGDAQYTFIGHVGVNVGDDSNETQGDALMKTTDKNAGSPIPADGLHFIRDFSEVKEGWEPVTLFCGLPYDFNTKYEAAGNTAVSGYANTEHNKWNRESVFMYYEPTEKYTGGEKYLAGVFFLNGYDREITATYKYKQTQMKYTELTDKIKTYPNTTIYDVNLAQSIEDIRLGKGVNDKCYGLQENICWCYTYNPKRAIYDIVMYESDTYNDMLAYSINKKSETGGTINYAACSAICQQAVDYSSPLLEDKKWPSTRFISPYNAFINSRALFTSDYDFEEQLKNGVTWTNDGVRDFKFGYKMTNFLPKGMYVSGYTAGKDPLRLSDVVLSNKGHTWNENNGEITHNVSGDKTLDGGTPTGAFHCVYDIKSPNSYKQPLISYPEWQEKSDSNTVIAGTYVHMFIRGSVKSEPKYISSVCVGSYSRELYRKTLENQKENVDDKKVNEIDPSVNASAMLNAACGCSNELIPFNIGCNQSDAWYNRQKNGKADSSAPKDTAAAYIGVSRTDDPTKAITAVLLYQNDDYPTANQIKIDNAVYYCDSSSAPIVMNEKQYYLYYTRNPGVLTGDPIEELVIDELPMIDDGMTALGAKAGSSSVDVEADLPYYIHLKSQMNPGSYYYDFYIGKGNTKNKALADLVGQECARYVDIDLNKGAGGSFLYFGYSMGYLEPDADEEAKEDAYYEAVYDIIITKGQPYQPDGFVSEENNIYYTPASDVDLNDHEGEEFDADEIYLYYCTPYFSAKYNRAQKKANTGVVTALPEEVFSAPITKIAFAQYDRVPYNSSLAGTNTTGNEILPWEYVMFSDHSSPADLNAGAYIFNADGYAPDNRITMFVQRADGSVKPAGEITGGFVTDTMPVGSLFKK